MSETLNPNLLIEELSEDEIAVLDVQKRSFFTLNATAKRIFEGLRDGRNVDEIARSMAEAFDVDVAECRADVVACVEQMTAQGLLVPTAPSTD